MPFAHHNVTEISCHCRGAQWFVPGVVTVLDVGGQDSKGIKVGAKGEVADFVMNDKCAAGTGRFMEIVAEVLHVPLPEIGPLSLQSTKVLPFSTTCAAFGRGAAVTMLKQGERKEDILAGLHEAIATRVTSLVRKVGLADKFVITGGIGRNVGLVSKIEQRLDGLKVTLPQEPMIVGALGAALFALGSRPEAGQRRSCQNPKGSRRLNRSERDRKPINKSIKPTNTERQKSNDSEISPDSPKKGFIKNLRTTIQGLHGKLPVSPPEKSPSGSRREQSCSTFEAVSR